MSDDIILKSVQRLSAFTRDGRGGNPAGVWIGSELPTPKIMQSTAANVGYSETAFASPTRLAGREEAIGAFDTSRQNPKLTVADMQQSHWAQR